jgi:transposase
MNEVSTIGVDLAKSVFQLHGVDAEGRPVLRRQLWRSQVLEVFQRLPACLVGMEACASAHYWARELTKLGHEVRLMQPSYVKGYVKRGKTDKADAEAICEAVSRPSMRFVPVKSADRQALLMTHKAREFLVRQQTQTVNAIRAHLGEFGIVVAKGIHNADRLIAACDRADLPVPARKALNLLADQLVDTQRKIEDLTADIHADAKASDAAQRLQTIHSPSVSNPWRHDGSLSAQSRPARWWHSAGKQRPTLFSDPPHCRMCRTSGRAGICPRRAEGTPLA